MQKPELRSEKPLANNPGDIMSALSVSSPFVFFTGLDGMPLNDGGIFIGVEGQNPETNPIAIYWDDALTQPAAQPLKTLAGYISRNGTPANIFTSGNYSITVRAKDGSFVFSSMSNNIFGSLAQLVSTEVYADLLNTTDPLKGDALVGVKYPYTGGIARTQHGKNQDFVSIDDFGAVGDGVTDDTAPVTAFFNSAISRPGVEHRLNAKTYAVSSVLPTINKSNVKIIGEGSELHDTGVLVTGTVLKWIGTFGTVGPLVKISAISGAGNQRVANVTFDGVGIDCNSGAINYGLEVLSISDSLIDVSVANAGFAGVQTGVVGSLGEAKDVQKCVIKIKSRQIEKRTAFCLVCSGDAIANTSLNEFWVDAQITDVQAVYLVNSDNNDWRLVRAFVASGGTATEGVSCLGGATEMERCRGERFHYYTSQVPIHVYGTSGSPSYVVASGGHSIFCLDTENGTPGPTIEVGGQINWRKDVSAMSDNAWIAYTPILGAQSGTLTSATAKGRYIRRGNIVYVKMQIAVTTNGSASGFLTASIPTAQVGDFGSAFAGQERGVAGKGLQGWLDGGGSSTLVIKNYDGTYPGSNGSVMELSGFYETT